MNSIIATIGISDIGIFAIAINIVTIEIACSSAVIASSV